MDLSSVTELRDRLRGELARGQAVLEGVELAIAALEQNRGVLLNTPTPKLAPPARRKRRAAKTNNRRGRPKSSERGRMADTGRAIKEPTPRKSRAGAHKAPRVSRRSPDSKKVAQLEQLAKLWDEGKKGPAIAKATGLSTAMVYYHAKKLGLLRRSEAQEEDGAPAAPCGPELDAEIAARSKRGQWDNEIAAVLHVSLADVRAALVRTGIRQALPAPNSQ